MREKFKLIIHLKNPITIINEYLRMNTEKLIIQSKNPTTNCDRIFALIVLTFGRVNGRDQNSF